jgi:hypothetical protein
MGADVFGMVLAGLVAPWITEILKRYPFVERYHYAASMVIAFALAMIASLLADGFAAWSDPKDIAANLAVVFTTAELIYRTFIKDRPVVQGKLRSQE